MSPKTPRANLALGPLPLFLSWLPQGIDRTLPGKVQGLTETLISAALGEGCPWGRNTGQEWPKDCQQHSDSVLRQPFGKGAGETGSGMGLGAVLVSLSTLSWAACSSATFDVR